MARRAPAAFLLCACIAVALAGAGAIAGTTAPVIRGEVHGTFGIEKKGSILVYKLRATRVPKGADVVMRCTRLCKRREQLHAKSGGVVRSRAFADKLRLPKGSVLEVTATKKGYVGW